MLVASVRNKQAGRKEMQEATPPPFTGEEREVTCHSIISVIQKQREHWRKAMAVEEFSERSRS